MAVVASDLFPAQPVFLPTRMSGETLYSWCARYHRLSANRLAADTSRQLFGARTAGFGHDLPSHLGNFSERTQNLFGSVDHLARCHTLLGFYAPFKPQALIDEAIVAMTGTSVARLKFRLGLHPSRAGADHPLKACPRCCEEDRATNDVSYWHLEHQWPSVWSCPWHGDLLQVCLARNKQCNHLQWLLPDDISLEQWWTPPSLELNGMKFLTRLARLTVEMNTQSGISYDPERLRRTCLVGAKSQGWLRTSGVVDLISVRQAFLRETSGLSVFPGMSFVENVAREDGGFVGSLLRSVRGHKHPVKYLLLMNFLFEDWSSFVEAHESASEYSESHGRAPVTWIDPRRPLLARLVREENLTICAVARRLELPVSMAVQWAREDDVPYRRRPRVVDKDVAAKITEELKTGDGCDEIANRTAIPLAIVRSYRDTHAEVRALWNAARVVKIRDGYRQKFLAILEANPGLSLTYFRTLPGSGYIWLFNHDRDWLSEHLPGFWMPR